MERLQLVEKVKKLFDSQGPLCNSEGFYNHEGECWNDALQMIFLYSDGIKEIVQKKLAEDPIDPAEVDTLFRPFMEESVKKSFHPEKKPSNKNTNANKEINHDKYKNANDDTKVQLGLMYISLVYEYLTTLQKRFYRHYLAESMRIAETDKVCSTEEKKGYLALERLKEISMAFRAKGKEGVRAGLFGKELQLKNITLKRDPGKLSDVYESGGGPASQQNVINIFTQFFSLPIQIRKYVNTYNFYGDRFQNPDTKENYSIKDNTIAIYCGIRIEGTGHAIAFYRCGGRSFLYDDNYGTILFPWMSFFRKGLEEMSNQEKNKKVKWIKHHKFKYATNHDNLVDIKYYFNGILVIRNEKDQILFKSRSYPYIQRYLYEYNQDGDKVQVSFFTYLLNGIPINLSTEDTTFPLEYETNVEMENGETISVSFVIEKPKVPVPLTSFKIIDFEGTLPKNQQKKEIYLGSRIREYDPIVENLIFQEQVRKIQEGKAKVNDVFKDEHTLLTMGIETANLEKIKIALNLGADIHKPNRQETPFFYAMTNDGVIDLDVAEYLLNQGADKDLNSNNNLIRGFTPLIGCIVYNEDEEMADTVRFLLKKGAKVDIPSKENILPIEYAMFFSVPVEVYQLLFEHGAVAPKCPTKAELLKRIGSDSQVMHWIRQENIVKAANLSKCYRNMEYEIYDDLNYENMIGETAVKLALHLPQNNWSTKLIDTLLLNGADVNHVDRYGTTPLYTAIRLGKLNFVKTLIDNNANPNIVLGSLGTPLDYAKHMGHKEIVDYLEEKLSNPKYSTKRFKKQSTTRKENRSKQNWSFVKRATKRAINKAKATV